MENFSPENAVDAEKARLAADGTDAAIDLMDDRFAVTLNPDKVVFDVASLYAAPDSFAAMTLKLDRDVREHLQGGQTTREREERARSSTDNFVHMMQLQSARIETRIAELDAEIAGYDAELLAMAWEYFTEQEMAEFEALPEDEKWEAMDNAMREKLENGEITQAEYDRWRETYEDKLEAEGRRDELEEDLRTINLQSDEDIDALIRNEEWSDVEAAAAALQEESQRLAVDNRNEALVDEGSEVVQETSDQDLLSGFEALAPPTTSAAQTIDPVHANAGSLRPAFGTAASESTQLALGEVRDLRPQGLPHNATT